MGNGLIRYNTKTRRCVTVMEIYPECVNGET